MQCPFKKCGAEWTPRVANPIQCPRCKRVLPQGGLNGNSKDADTGRAGSDAAVSDERTGNGAAMPVLRKGKGSKERLYLLPAVRDKLVVGGDGPAGLPESRPSRSASEKCPHGKLNAAYCRATGGGC